MLTTRSIQTLIMVVTLLASVESGKGDCLIKESLELGNKPTKFEYRIKGNKIRVDQGRSMSSLKDISTGEVAVWFPDQGEMTKTTAALAPTIEEETVARQREDPPASEFKPTGLHETINGYPCEEYVLYTRHGEFRLFFDRDIPNFREIISPYLESIVWPIVLRRGRSKRGDYGILLQNYPGMPIRIVEYAGRRRLTSTIESIEQKALPDSFFTIPDGYKTKLAQPIGAK